MNQLSTNYVIPNDWKEAFLQKEMDEATSLKLFLKKERSETTVYPDSSKVFRAFDETLPHDVQVVIMGQDPYYTGVADGLAFSSTGKMIPPSLMVIYKELYRDFAKEFVEPKSADLSSWARQGVLLLNRVLTVRSGKAKTHYNEGWERITTKAIECLGSDTLRPKVFMLWGKEAQALSGIIDKTIHLVLTAPHPAAELYAKGAAGSKFTGCSHFSKANNFLQSRGRKPIDWFTCMLPSGS